MDLHQALEKHAEWKVKFRSAIAKKERLNEVNNLDQN